MAAEAAEKLKKVQKYSASLRRLFRFVFVLTAVALVVETIVMLTGLEPPNANVRVGNMQYSGDAISAAVRVFGYVQFALSSGIVLKLNFHLVKLFGLYADGQIFGAENVEQIRQIGITMLLFPALAVLTLFVPLLLPAGPGQMIVGGLGMPFVQIVVGIVVIVVAWIMDVGRELREEQELVV